MSQEQSDSGHLAPHTPEKSARNFDIIRYPEAVVVVNNNVKLSHWGRKLADVLECGVPEDWHRIEDSPNVYVGEIDGRQFVAKHRAHRPSRPGQTPFVDETGFQEEELSALERLSHEIQISHEVKAAIDSPRLQGVVRVLGFKSIRFVEPIAGVIVNHSDQTPASVRAYDRAGIGTTKIMAYEYIPGAYYLGGPESYDILERLHISFLRKTALESEISNQLIAAGIKPGDFGISQVLIDGEGNLFLVDAEAYTKIK